MKILSTLLLLLAFVTPSHACRVRVNSISLQQRLASAQEVHLGVVTGIVLSDLEHDVLKQHANVIAVGDSGFATATIYATLKGPVKNTATAKFSGCGNPPELRSEVVVLKVNGGYSISSDPTLVQLVEQMMARGANNSFKPKPLRGSA